MSRRVIALAAATMVLASCTAAGSNGSTLTVYAASSLTEVFTSLAHRFEHDHAGVHVELNFGASSALATSIVNGAPADVFAAAAPAPMATVVKASAATAAAPFATNVLEIAVPPGNPGRVAGLTDLARSGLKVALCDPAVPCGSAAKKVLNGAGVRVSAVSLEPDVKAALAKVRLGEVDAALVYVTDVRAAGTSVAGVAIPDAANARTTYPIAVLARAGPLESAREFVAYVRSAAGQAVLRAAGFGPP